MAYSALVEGTVSIPCAAFYGAIADFGAIGGILPAMIKNCDLQGAGVGATRTVELNPDGGFEGIVVERVDAAYDGRLFSYSIVGDSPLPVSDYVAVIEIEDAGPGECRVRHGSNWVVQSGSEAETREMFEGLYNAILDGIEKM